MEIVITRKKDLEAKKHSADAEVSSLRTTNLAGEFTTLLLSFSQIRNFRRLRKELTLSNPFSICWKADAQHWPARSEKYLPRTKRSQEHLTTSKKERLRKRINPANDFRQSRARPKIDPQNYYAPQELSYTARPPLCSFSDFIGYRSLLSRILAR